MSVPFRNNVRRAGVVSLSAICLDLASCSSNSDDPAVPDLQPDCGPVFANFGLSIDDGSASASGNTVFALQ